MVAIRLRWEGVAMWLVISNANVSLPSAFLVSLAVLASLARQRSSGWFRKVEKCPLVVAVVQC